MLKNFFRYFISSLFFLIVSSLSANAEFKAGFIYIGKKDKEPNERRRPIIDKVVSFI